jgi:hypothetical protein
MPRQTSENQFGVYQKEFGSYTMDGFRFEPLTAVAVSKDIADKACPIESPVRFFETEAAAQEAIAKLKAEFANKPRK